MLSIITYILFFSLFIFTFLNKLGIALLCYLSLLTIYFFAEYYGLYGYYYINYELRERVHDILYYCKKRLLEVSEVYNYFYIGDR